MCEGGLTTNKKTCKKERKKRWKGEDNYTSIGFVGEATQEREEGQTNVLSEKV